MQRFFARLLIGIYRRLGILSSLYYVNAGEALPPRFPEKKKANASMR